MISSTTSSLCVRWRPGFDGGEEQSFQLEYRKVNPVKGIPDTAEPMTVYINSHNATYQALHEVRYLKIIFLRAVNDLRSIMQFII